MRLMLPFCLAVSLFALTAAPASAYQFDPPSWWNEGRALMEARGATCDAETRLVQAEPGIQLTRRDSSGQSVESAPYTRQGFSCARKIPEGSRTFLPSFEGCFAEVDDSSQPHLDSYHYTCDVLAANPGTDAQATLFNWVCSRSDGGGPDYPESTLSNIWGVASYQFFQPAETLSLDKCRAPRAFLDDGTQSAAVASRRGVGVGVTCSDACTVELRATRASVASGPTGVASATLKAATKRVVRAPIPRGVRRGKLRLLIKVSARGYSKRGRGSATFRGSTLKVNMPARLDLSKR